MIDRDEKTARQAKLSKALSTAYLSHQISQLEEKVRDDSIEKPKRVIPAANGIDETEFPPLGAEAIPKSKKEPVLARVDDSGSESVQSFNREDHGRRRRGRGRGGMNGHGRRHANHSDDTSDDEEYGWRVVVLDTSALLWAPQGVRKLVRQGWEVIVPLEALRTLDLLKSGSSPSARAARSAARYIEHSTRHFKPLPSQSGYKRGKGLRLQRDEEVKDPDSVSSLPIPNIDGDVLPKWMENILACAAYFISVQVADETNDEHFGPAAALCVANPPLSVEEEEGYTGNIGQRGEGYLISQEAERYEIPIEVLRDEEDDVEHEQKAKRPSRGKGKGQGRGRQGKSGGRREEDGPEREVKILLRRPADESDTPDIPGPHLSSPSTNRSALPSATLPHGQSANPANLGSPIGKEASLPPPRSHRPPPPFGRGPPHGPPFHGHPPPPHDQDRHMRPPPFGHPVRPPRGDGFRPPPDDARLFDAGGRGRGRGRGGGRGRGRGQGPAPGEFVLLQRPGPPPREERMGGGNGGPKVVLLQRPKPG